MWPRGRGPPRGSHPGRGHRGHMRGRGGNGNFRGRNFRGMGSRGFPNRNQKPFNKNFAPREPNKQDSNNEIDRKNLFNELDAGISQYISNCEGFTGVLKARFSDFHVNEIDMDGNITKLTDLRVPDEPEPIVEEDDESVVDRYRIEQLPIETWDKLHNLVQNKNRNEIIEVDVTSATKEERKKIHDAVRTVFGKKLVGQTIDKADKKFIIFKLFNKNDIVDQRTRWPATRGGEFVYFLVHKQQTDTIEASIMISEALHMKPTHITYAGVKDRRAKTTQWFCVKKVDPQRIFESTKKLQNMHIGNYCYKKETLKLGQLKGNRFRIALREISAENDLIEKALVSLRDNGFINYYGLQRFGNSKEIPTYKIGVELLKGNWAEAVSLILKPRNFEKMKDVADAKLTYHETGDAKLALSKLRKNRNSSIEGRLLHGIVAHKSTDYVNALESIPRNMRLLYIHSYQSLVWNMMVSRRIKEFGLKPIVGDLILTEQDSDAAWEAVETDKYINEEFPINTKVKSLSEDDLEKYTIYDVVLPLPGFDIIYPDNVVKDWYKEYLEKDGLSLEMNIHKVKTYSLSGAYRKIVEQVTNMSWEFMQYETSTSNLIQSDVEELRGQLKPKSCEDGKFKALILDFCLTSSCYATMALRELMKIDLSWNQPSKPNQSTEDTKKESIESTKDSKENQEKSSESTKQEENGSDKKSDSTLVKIENIKQEISELENELSSAMETGGNETKRKIDDKEENISKKLKTEL